MSKRQHDRDVAKEELRRKRELAKAGMAASMGSVLLTGMLGKKKAHIASGVAFLGFAYWHTTLYAHNPSKRRHIEPLESTSRESQLRE